MKIAINGNIIETENIYRISPVEEDRQGCNCMRAIFRIYIFNVPEPFIVAEEWLNSDLFDNMRILNNMKEMLGHLRSQIISIWDSSKSPIPEFNSRIEA